MSLAAFSFEMDDRQSTLLDDLRRADSLTAQEARRSARRAAWLVECSTEQWREWLTAVYELPPPLDDAADRLLATWLAAVNAERSQAARSGAPPLPPVTELLPEIQRLYHALTPVSRARAQFLPWLANSTDDAALDLLAEILVADPPADDNDVVLALAPLFQRRRREAARLFPRLLAALAHPALAAPVLDLANFLSREQLVPRHPAADQSAQLIQLLGNLVHSLEALEERQGAQGQSPQDLSQKVSRGVALAVSLCDALAQIGDKAAIGKLRQTLALPHRRIRTEAAAALARLGDDEGRAELIQLAAQPVARLRVLAYAAELSLLDRIDPEFQTPLARAEAELCVWLAEPTQYGVPPAACELYDQRRWRWPGFDEPVDCFLFRFQYAVTLADQERSFSNIGIAGPVTHAVLADLSDLPPDDIYALFAGWQAQHEEIREFEVARLARTEQLEVARLARRLNDAGYAQIEPQRLGYFFGDKALVASARHQGVPGVAVADFQEIAFFPERHSQRPIGASEAYWIYKGRRLLAAFNR